MAKIRKRPRVKGRLAQICPECGKPNVFAVDLVHRLPNEAPPEEYTFSHCDTCKKPAIFYREDVGDGFDSDSYFRIYPPPQRHAGYSLPKIVRDSYEDAVGCEGAKAWIACVVMVGRTLEAVCKEFDPGTKNVFEGLRSLHRKGIISNELLEWANELRVLRNLGAHATSEKIDVLDATGALDFLQAILEIMYDLRPRFEEFKKRRKAT
ncbi:MAG TPA: DUF4145 domain-containing protein [Chthoniobacterales bacterium]